MILFLSMCGRIARVQLGAQISLGDSIDFGCSVARGPALCDSGRIAGVVARAAVVYLSTSLPAPPWLSAQVGRKRKSPNV